MKYLFLSSMIFLSSVAYADAVRDTDLIKDQTDIVSDAERRAAGKIKSKSGWEVYKSAYNKKTGNIEIIAKNDNKYSRVAVNPRTTSFNKRALNFLKIGLRRYNAIGWLASLAETFAPSNDYTIVGDEIVYNNPVNVTYYWANNGVYYTDLATAAQAICRHNGGRNWQGSETLGTNASGAYIIRCTKLAHEYHDDFVTALDRQTDQVKKLAAQSLLDQSLAALPAAQANRDFVRRVAEYDLVGGLYDTYLDRDAITVSDATAEPVFVKNPALVSSTVVNPAIEPLPYPVSVPESTTATQPATNTEPATSPANNSLALPAFCVYAPGVCDFFDWVKRDEKEKEQERDDEIGQIEINKTATDFDKSYIKFGKTCPAPYKHSVTIMDQTAEYEFDLSPFCLFAEKIRPFVIAMAYFFGFGIVATSIRN